jgi:hypothetical protein
MFVDREAPSLQKYRNLITLVFTRILRQLETKEIKQERVKQATRIAREKEVIAFGNSLENLPSVLPSTA